MPAEYYAFSFEFAKCETGYDISSMFKESNLFSLDCNAEGFQELFWNITKADYTFYNCIYLKYFSNTFGGNPTLGNKGSLYLKSYINSYREYTSVSADYMFHGCSSLDTKVVFKEMHLGNCYCLFGQTPNTLDLGQSEFKFKKLNYSSNMPNISGAFIYSGVNSNYIQNFINAYIDYFNKNHSNYLAFFMSTFLGCTNLKTLDFSKAQFGISLNEAIGYSSIETLILDNSPLTDSDNLENCCNESSFNGCDKLKTISMKNCNSSYVEYIRQYIPEGCQIIIS